MIIKARSPFHIQQQNLVAAPETPQLLCEDIDFAGFEVNVSGAITQGTAKLIEDQTALTISSISPASFDRAVVTEPRTIFVNITIPSGYLNAGGTLNCSTIVTQEAQAIVLTCKTMRVINNSTTETLKVKYIECGNVEKILSVGTDSQQDVCVESNTSITYHSGSTNWQEKFISYGCTRV